MANVTDKTISFSLAGSDKPDYQPQLTVNAGIVFDLFIRLTNIAVATIKFKLLSQNDDETNDAVMDDDDWSTIVVDSNGAKLRNNNNGQLTITPPVGQIAEFYFRINNFKSAELAGISEILVFEKDHQLNSLIINKIIDQEPFILSFDADHYFTKLSTPVTFTWEAKNVTNFKLFYGESIEIKLHSPKINHYKFKSSAGSGNYTLQGFNEHIKQHPFDTATLNLRVYDESKISVIHQQFPDNARILGLYPDTIQNELYALVQKENDIEATLYKATHNILQPWKTEYVNKPAQTSDTSDIVPVTLPLTVATRPGVIFENKLWLIGGSSYDPDVAGNTHGFLDLKTKEWIDKEAVSRGNNTMLPRMGHVCIVHDGKIWIIGGHNPDHYSALKDMWTYRDGSWEKLEQELPSGKCMMAACSRVFEQTTANLQQNTQTEQLLLFGGYEDMPAGKRSFEFFCMNKAGRFERIEPTGLDAKAKEYNAVAMAANTTGDIYVFADKAYRLDFTDIWTLESRSENSDWRYDENGHKLQTVAFNEGVWINSVSFPEGKAFLKKRGHLFHAFFVD